MKRPVGLRFTICNHPARPQIDLALSSSPQRLQFGGASSTWTVKGTQGMEGLENTTVTAVDQLAALYARPSERVLRKDIDHVDAVGRAFIAASPFLILAAGDSHGLDCSPKGDKPGFVQVEDDRFLRLCCNLVA
jgi:hypothetical protein